VWREHKKGFLKPMPIPDRYHSEIAMHFMTKLPPSDTRFSKTKATNILVIADRLLQSVTLDALPTTDAESVADYFMWTHFRFHGFPNAVTSDQGPQWVGRFWRRMCHLAGIEQRLSTTYHPQTDGRTERWNQEVWAYLRAYVDFMQDDWARWLPQAQLALNNRPNSTGLTPYFIEHGYHPSSIDIKYPDSKANSPEGRAEAFMHRLQQVQDFSQSAMAAAQQQQEYYANKKRSAPERFQVGDKVWLSHENYRTERPKKKMDWLRGKYTVSKASALPSGELAFESGYLISIDDGW